MICFGASRNSYLLNSIFFTFLLILDFSMSPCSNFLKYFLLFLSVEAAKKTQGIIDVS